MASQKGSESIESVSQSVEGGSLNVQKSSRWFGHGLREDRWGERSKSTKPNVPRNKTQRCICRTRKRLNKMLIRSLNGMEIDGQAMIGDDTGWLSCPYFVGAVRICQDVQTLTNYILKDGSFYRESLKPEGTTVCCSSCTMSVSVYVWCLETSAAANVFLSQGSKLRSLDFYRRELFFDINGLSRKNRVI
jgi:hypothetical protein